MRTTITLYCAISLLLLSFTHVLVPVTATSSTTDCSSLTMCLPWDVSPTCQRGKPISLRFMLGTSPYFYWTDTSGNQYNYTVYSFCPNVDSLQSFTLKGAGLMVAGTKSSGTAAIYTPVPSVNLSIYGFGDTDSRQTPLPNSNGTVLVAEGSQLCGSANNVLVASILLLNIGLHKGQFNYLSTTVDKYQWGNNTNYNTTLCAMVTDGSYKTYNDMIRNNTNCTNSTTGNCSSSALGLIDGTIDYCDVSLWETNGTYQLPAKTGFSPTCSLGKDGKDVCSFDSNAPCIGAVAGAKNCAKCYSNITALANANIQIWTSYFGSDSKGATLLSGGTNPMTYYKFAGGDIFTNIASQLNSVANLVANESGKVNTSIFNFSNW